MTLIVLAAVWPWFAFHYFPRKQRSKSARLGASHGERFVRYRREVPALWPRLRGWRSEASIGSSDRWALDRYSKNNELGTLLALSLGVLVFWLRSGAGFG